MAHDRAYHRFKDEVKKQRKIHIIHELWDRRSWEWLQTKPRRLGQLVKGKVHCSCPDCNPKTGRNGWKISEYKRLVALSDELIEEYGNA